MDSAPSETRNLDCSDGVFLFKDMLVSIDFDCTLSRRSVQDWVRSKITDCNIECIIITSMSVLCDNSDISTVCSDLGIKNVIFTNGELKSVIISRLNPIIHLDDCFVEINSINRDTSTVGISVWGNSSWMAKCEKILNKEKAKQF